MQPAGSRVRCTCHGTIHPLVPTRIGALMCENCGNIVCTAQGPGSCVFCGAACNNERFTVSDELVTPEGAQSASEEAKQISARLKEYVRKDPAAPLTDMEKRAAEQLRQTMIKNFMDAAEVDPAMAVKDDQDGLLGLLGD